MGPTLRVTLMDKKAIGKDDILGEGQIDITPAYHNPYVSDNKYIDILKNGVIFARVYCSIEYQGNAMNNNGMANQNYSMMSSIVSNGLHSLMNNSNYNNMGSQMGQNRGMGMGNNENININIHPSEIKSVLEERSPMAQISNSRIEDLGYSNVKPLSGSRITTIETIETTSLPTTTYYTH